MKNKAVKIIIAGLIGLVAVCLAVFMYRLYFLFSPSKIKEYIDTAASQTEAPNKAYELINEMVEYIKKSQDLSRQAIIMSEIDEIEKEQALVLMALHMCYSNGVLSAPEEIEMEVGNE